MLEHATEWPGRTTYNRRVRGITSRDSMLHTGAEQAARGAKGAGL